MSTKSATLHSAFSPPATSARPRRRTSLSIALTPRPYAYATLQPALTPRRRARTMPHAHRSGRARREHPTTIRKSVIVLLVLLALILLGTVVVLSTVSYYLAIPTWAYLTESEVAWRPEDVIRPLRDVPVRPRSARLAKRVEWRELDVSSTFDAVTVDSSTIYRPADATHLDATSTAWDEIAEEMEELDDVEDADVTYVNSSTESISNPESTLSPIIATPTLTDTDDYPNDSWGIDGKGTGGYWMRKDWDGKVKGVTSWDRLYNVTNKPGETIPRLIHQTWKDDQLPEKWRKAWRECREGMPDYEYMLWTDAVSREFVATHYPAHLHMYDSYQYPIQRADSIRYFVLHHFGGVYMDLDIGCRRRLDPLLQGDWDVILPITKPVGISNDLIFSAKGSSFMDDSVHGLSAFNHRYFSNYPTVMFSTGPMFLSAQYALYSASHPLTTSHPRPEVRVLPKSLYGKNAPISDVPHSFFSHFYGSSWHSDDAGFITFLGDWGKKLMWVGGVVILIGVARLLWVKRNVGKEYQLLSLLPMARSASPNGYDTPTSSGSFSGMLSPTSVDSSISQQIPSDIASVFKRAGNLILAAPATLLHGDRRRRRQGLLYFVPAIFTPVPSRRSRTASEASQLPMRRSRRDRERDRARAEHESLLPPPYEQREESSSSRSPSPLVGVSSHPSLPSAPPPASAPPPPKPSRKGAYEGGGSETGGEATMDDVDAFLNDADNEGSASGSGGDGEGYGEDAEGEGWWRNEQGRRR